MKWMEFVASLVGSLAWPALLVVLLFIFRKQLTDLVPLLRRLRYKELELEFGEKVARVAEQAGELALTTLVARESSEVDRLAAIAELSPRAAILEAWLEVEKAAADIAVRADLSDRHVRAIPPTRLGDLLQRRGVLPPDVRAVYDELRALRNEAAHAPDPEFHPAMLRDYVALALSLAEFLRNREPR